MYIVGRIRWVSACKSLTAVPGVGRNKYKLLSRQPLFSFLNWFAWPLQPVTYLTVIFLLPSCLPRARQIKGFYQSFLGNCELSFQYLSQQWAPKLGTQGQCFSFWENRIAHLGQWISSSSLQNDGSFISLRFYLFLERGEEGEKERERNINVWLPFMHPLLGTWPATQACALTWNWTSDLSEAGTQSTEPHQLGQMPVLDPGQTHYQGCTWVSADSFPLFCVKKEKEKWPKYKVKHRLK